MDFKKKYLMKFKLKKYNNLNYYNVTYILIFEFWINMNPSRFVFGYSRNLTTK